MPVTGKDYLATTPTAQFYVRVRETGSKSFVVGYYPQRGGVWTRYTIGALKKYSWRAAVTEAKRLIGQIADGKDPQKAKIELREAEKRRAALAKKGIDKGWRLSKFINLYLESVSDLRSVNERERA